MPSHHDPQDRKGKARSLRNLYVHPHRYLKGQIAPPLIGLGNPTGHGIQV